MVKKAKQAPSLTLLYEDREVADLRYDLDRQEFHLVYSAHWNWNADFVLSPHLPLSGEFSSENTRKFLENLLPEGEALKTLARTLKISPSNIYALLAAIGRDTTGAFSFSVNGEKVETSFRPLPIEELEQRIRERASKPISIWDGKPRLSLAGVQEKLAVTLLKDGQYGFGEGELASTHILKFGRKDQYLILNEYFCMKLAERVGLSVAHVELIRLGERVLQVERFDREWKFPHRVARIHILDACQMLDAPPEFKYQRIIPVGPNKDDYLGPIDVTNLSALCRQCAVPAKAQLQLLRWILFNLIIGNTDNHGKNISYIVTRKGYEIAPAYDLVNVSMYEDFHQELAFKIGDTFVLDDVKAFQLVEMSEHMGLAPRFVATHLRKICQEALKHIDSIHIEELSDDERDFMDKLRNNIQDRAERFLAQSSLINSIASKVR